ncbi:MAG: flippase-like domain-containing protein, partial [Candidatus Omnitrophica bacterium]|nr:flippase-like domain-containing protein [Candidatus Omnitrophota bacterium]MBU1997189.1 flippase-like domain-containing protein [Candidatus Omnitrophota bacterium]
MSYKNHFRTIASFLVTVIMFFLLFKKVPLDQVYLSVKNSDIKLILLIVIVALFNGFFVSALRWKLILKVMGFHLSFKEAFFVKVASDPIIGAVPLKIGEISRILYLKKFNGIAPENTAFSIFTEYILNILTLVFFTILGVLVIFIKGLDPMLGNQPVLALCSIRLEKFLSGVKWITLFKQRFLKCFKNENIFKNKNILFLSFWFGLLEIACFFFLAKAINVDLPFSEVLLCLPIIILLSSSPITFLGLGMREGIVILLFQKYASAQN